MIDIYRLRPDNDQFRLELYGEHTDGEPPWWKYQSLVSLYDAFEREQGLTEKKLFLLSTLMLRSGEGKNRSVLERITVRGTRNIRLKIEKGTKYLYDAIADAKRQIAEAKREKDKSKSVEMMVMENEEELLNESLRLIKERLGLPFEEDPVQNCYKIPEEVIQEASDACKTYLKQVKVWGFLTTYRFKKVKEKLAKLLQGEYKDNEEAHKKALEKIIRSIEKNPTTEHLSAISLTSKNGHLLVSIVNVRGEMITMEAWKLLRLIDDHGKQINLGLLGGRGYWEPEPLLEFSLCKAGEVYALYHPQESVLHVACERTRESGNGRMNKEPLGKAAFIIDQNYLVCLYMTIKQLRADKKRFEALREKAEAQVVTNVNDLFDPCLFE